MEEESQAIRVNFGRPMPVFPLDEVALLPNAVAPLHIFEPRYQQMIGEALDGPGQIAVAAFEGDRWKQEYHGRPPLRPAVCIAQIVQHERLPDGRFNILLQGVCRARIEEEVDPDADRLYRAVILAPVGDPEDDEEEMPDVRFRLGETLRADPLTRFVDHQGGSLCEGLAAYLDRDPDEVSTSVAIDLIGQYLIKAGAVRYALLAEADPAQRARIIERELDHLRSLLQRAELQIDPDAPKGVNWN
ncbi:MAG: hypothetical protein EA379_02395 [Phycisphaerales bacterium]|nr:MAG: hypothetical protein EA379_02395 [Phycisphaerales bacterium]